ncbi:MAG: hypothetical protein BAJALOKI2v1_290006 [Promethearchaeota archaeon]|nr:MAG: hypothetical protein BAJALOKI2v1_290006 [Candidatus Lokiarchaeota archaeon]
MLKKIWKNELNLRTERKGVSGKVHFSKHLISFEYFFKILY